MSRFQLILIAILILLPIALFGGVGAWALWSHGHLLWLWWTMPVCWGIAWVLVRRAGRVEVPLPEIGSRVHWTPNDHAAAAIVAEEQKRMIAAATAEQLTNRQFYEECTVELATKLARHYHPKSDKPLEELSVIEVLAVVHLVAEDMEDLFSQYVPGSHLVTVKQWRQWSSKENRDIAVKVWSHAKEVWWLASFAMAINPGLTLSKYALTKVFLDPATKFLQEHGQALLFGRFFMLYLRQVGFYLIELNSGRLRGGAARYRRAMAQLEQGTAGGIPVEKTAPEPVTVTIAIIGQVKAGKSSLVNCLLGDRQAAVDVLPLTKDVDRYELQIEESTDRLILLDTPGYSDAGATREQVEATREAVRQADLILLVMAATSPAKQADAKMVNELNDWFREQRRLKPPPIVGVVSKIDGLRPVMEWSPPYDWQHPSRPKERSIREAVDFAGQSAGAGLQGVVPVCSDRERGRIYGIEDWLLPTIIVQLDEARAVSLVRSLHHDYDRQKLRQTLSQFVEAGKRIMDALRQKLPK